ncbi:MoaD/ThiS family protein [Thermodesulfobacteriota bacterium]
MSIQINLHKTHRQYTDGLETIDVEGKTVSECLQHLIDKYPPLEKEIFQKTDKLSPIIEVYVNGESAYPDELAKQVKDGDKIHLIYMLAGG